MNYNFQNSTKLYTHILRQLQQPTKNRLDYENQYGQYKLARPKNQIRTKSIYTQQQSQYFGISSSTSNNNYINCNGYAGNGGYEEQYDNYNQDDIHKFLENSKTLREKIYERLEKKKVSNGFKNKMYKIKETTFRPNQVRQTYNRENINMNNNLSLVNGYQYNPYNNNNNNRINKQNNPTKYALNTSHSPNIKQPNIKINSRSKQRQSHGRTNRTKTQYSKQTKRVMTEVDEAIALWDPKGEKNMSQLDFYQRQQKTLTNRKEATKKLLEEKKEKQLEGCTFKPKLTKYKPQRM